MAWHDGNAAHYAASAGLVVVVMVALAAVAHGAANEPTFELRNVTKGKSAKIAMEVADDHFSRMRGLMFRDRIIPILFIFGGEGIFPIHSHFVRAPFDAVYVGKDGAVNELYRKIPPNTDLVTPKRNSTYLVELPIEITDRLRIEEGDKLEWKPIRK